VSTGGCLVGFTTRDERGPDNRSDARVVRIDQACEVLASADKKIAGAVPPDATHLPLDPQRPIAPSALSAAVKNRAGSLSPYPMSTTGFDIAFITPIHVYRANDQLRRAAMYFGYWSQFFGGHPRVLR